MKIKMMVSCIMISVLVILGIISPQPLTHATTTQSEKTLTFQTAFPDSALAKAVYVSLYPEQTTQEIDLTKTVTPKELSQIKTLTDTRDVPISDLTGIGQLTGLTTLALEGNEGGRIVNIFPLKPLKKLEKLTLRNEFISDLAPLASAKKLKELDLSHNKITHINSLQRLTQLEKLILSGNQITDFRPLKDLPVTNTTAFQAHAQTIVKDSATKTGRRVFAPKVYDTTGRLLSPQVVQGSGDITKIQAVMWGQPGKSKLQYRDKKKNPAIVVFVQYKAAGKPSKTATLQKKKASSNSPLIIKDANGKILNDTDYLLAPGNAELTKKDNSQAIADAIALVAQQPFNADHHKGSISLPNGEWHLMNKIELEEGQSLLGNQTTLIRAIKDFLIEPIETRDSVSYYDAMIDMASYSRVSGITLDGRKGDAAAHQRQNGITVKGHYTEGDSPTAPSDTDYLHDIVIEDMTIQNMTGSGIIIDLAKNVIIQGSTEVSDANHAMRVVNMGYDGIIGYSVDNMTLHRTLTKTIGHMKSINIPEQNYNLCQSMRKMRVNNPGHTHQIRYPVSHQGTISHNVVLDNAYEGIDGHSVQDYHIVANTIVDVQQAIITGGQNYPPAYYYPTRDVVITENRVNQQEDIKKWVGSLEEPSQAGIVLWGATRKTPEGPGSDEVGYSNGEISNNHVDHIQPTTAGTGFYGGIAIKNTDGVTVQHNTIGTQMANSVQLAGIAVNDSNLSTKILDNHIGYIGYTGDMSSINQTVYAPIAIRGQHNTSMIRNNTWDSKNPTVIVDEKAGHHSGNVLHHLPTNNWETEQAQQREADMFNYNIANLQWDTASGTVTGSLGKDVTHVALYQGTTEAIFTNDNHLITEGTIDADHRTFTITHEALKNGDIEDFVIVAQNTMGTNGNYHYKVMYSPLQNPEWFKLTVDPYDVRNSEQLQGTTLSDHVKKVRVRVDGDIKCVLDVTEQTFRGDIRKWLNDAVFQEVWVESLDTEGHVMFSKKVMLEDAQGFAMTTNPFVLPSDSKVKGTVGELVSVVQMAVNQKVINNLDTSAHTGAFQANVAPYVTSVDDDLQASSLDVLQQPRQTTAVTISDTRYALSIPTYDLSIHTLHGTVGEWIHHVALEVDGKVVNQVDTNDGAFSARMSDRIPSIFSKVEAVGYDAQGKERSRIAVDITDQAYAISANPYTIDDSYLTGNAGAKVAFADIYVNGKRANHLTLDTSGTYKAAMKGKINSITDEVEVWGIASDGKTVRSKMPVTLVDNKTKINTNHSKWAPFLEKQQEAIYFGVVSPKKE